MPKPLPSDFSESRRLPPADAGRKFDLGKERWDLVPLRAMREVVGVLTYGAAKYEPDNWKRLGEPFDRYYAAALRHLTSHRLGETLDPESGKPHLAHAICSLLFMLGFEAGDVPELGR